MLVLDEPTSALLPEQVEWLFAKVRAFAGAGGIAVFISHRLEEIENLSDRVTVFRGGVDVGSGAIGEMPEDAPRRADARPQIERFYPGAAATRGTRATSRVPGREPSAPPSLRDVSMEIRRGEIVGIGGLQGQGQLALFLALFGAQRRRASRSCAGREVACASRPTR